MDTEDKRLTEELRERFRILPKVVQNAITSADVEKHLRELANIHKLHLDQWEKLENEVMLALMGFKPAEQLQQNIKLEVIVSDEVAQELAKDISRIVFEPIRQELERELEHPEAKEKEVSGIEAARTQVLAESQALGNKQEATGTTQEASVPVSLPVQQQPPAAQARTPVGTTPPTIAPEPAGLAMKPVSPATPPPPQPTEKAVRAPTSSVYKPGEPSSVRKNVHDDPYRESPA